MSGGHDSGGGLRWLLTYADLITLLLALFILLYSTARQDLEKFRDVSDAFKKAFNVPVFEGRDVTALHGIGNEAAPVPLDDLDFVSEQVSRFVEAQSLFDDVIVGKTDDGLVISLTGSTFFESGSAELTPQGENALRQIGEIVAKIPNHIRVEGHTDNLPFSSPEFPSNWELSGARALTAMKFLAEETRVPYERLSFAGFGEYHPIADNGSREGRKRNRRVDIIALSSIAGSTPRVIEPSSEFFSGAVGAH